MKASHFLKILEGNFNKTNKVVVFFNYFISLISFYHGNNIIRFLIHQIWIFHFFSFFFIYYFFYHMINYLLIILNIFNTSLWLYYIFSIIDSYNSLVSFLLYNWFIFPLSNSLWLKNKLNLLDFNFLLL